MYLRLLAHNRDFRLFYFATPISLGGDWFLTGFVTLTMACSGLAAGIAADHVGTTRATIGIASMCVLFGCVWAYWTWRLWR